MGVVSFLPALRHYYVWAALAVAYASLRWPLRTSEFDFEAREIVND